MELETPKQVYSKFLEIISNEKESPELLEYEETLVECLIEQIEHMESNIERLKNKLDQFCMEQHRAEIDRLQFTVNVYLRTRIQKIEENCTSLIRILKNDSQRAQKLMSAGEIKYLDSYFVNIETYLSESVLGKLDIPIRDASQTFSLLELPDNDEDAYVFVKALKKTDVLVESEDGDQESVTLEPDSIHFLPYSSVRNFLNQQNNIVLM
ncbi:E3 ubiquitin-protein ligase KCMF1-like [Sarcoptes scabiei]|nr:E3 ubiquitin-protein ligase KCMF1-like [Sarcoptes scabiei]